MIASSPDHSCVFTPEPANRIDRQADREPATCITVLVAGGNMRLVRDLLKPHGDIEVVTQARDGREAAKLAAILSPDVVVVDIDTPVSRGVSVVPEVLAACPEIKVVILSLYVKQTDVEESFRSGAVGFLGKGAAAELPTSIRAAHQGRFFFAP